MQCGAGSAPGHLDSRAYDIGHCHGLERLAAHVTKSKACVQGAHDRLRRGSRWLCLQTDASSAVHSSKAPSPGITSDGKAQLRVEEYSSRILRCRAPGALFDDLRPVKSEPSPLGPMKFIPWSNDRAHADVRRANKRRQVWQWSLFAASASATTTTSSS